MGEPMSTATKADSTQAEEQLTPATTDVPAKYLAVVSPDDPGAVMDLVAIVPKTATSTEPQTFIRKDQEWVPNEQMLLNLKSATPPPVVQITDKAELNSVLLQVDKIQAVAASINQYTLDAHLLSFWEDSSITAAGGFDRNRGNAEELRRYWTTGEGAAKIRWGTEGDWTRCVRQLSKYMGVRAKGYCQLRHKDATGIYTGDRANPGNDFAADTFDLAMIEAASLVARAEEARSRFAGITASSMESGAKFSIPLLLPEQLESGDGRKFDADAIEIRELPLPLLWQIKTGEGHNGSVVVGRIDYMERIENGIGNAYGVFDSGPYGREAERLVRNGFIRGVSADLDQFEATEEAVEPADAENADGPEEVAKKKLTINHARVMAATIVAKPAFQECTIYITENGSGDNQEEEVIPNDGVYEESTDVFATDEALIASGFLASAIPTTPPTDWFQKPNLTKATPLTVDDTGRVFGHIAAWHVNHIGMPRATRPPRSKSKYAYFHTGVVRTDSGKDIPVGQLTLAGGHASLQANAQAAAKHYDDTASAIADVHAGEDDYGIWVAGSLRPDATESQIRALRASAPSGDWRPINGQLELVAVCQVNVPGFPIARALVASGKVMALVAAGANYMAVLQSEAVQTLANRAYTLGELSATAPTDFKSRARNAKKTMKKNNLTQLSATVDSLKERAMTAAAFAEFAYIPEDVRKEAAAKGHALPDGSFPIEDLKDLKAAIQAYGRAKASHKAAVRKHITKRARQLKSTDLIPESWKTAGSFEADVKVASMRAVIASVSEFADAKEATPEEIQKLAEAKGAADKQTEDEIKAAQDAAKWRKENPGEQMPTPEEKGKYTAKTQPRDDRGKFREVLARLKQNLGVAGLQDAMNKVQDAENLDFAGNYTDAAKAGEDLLGLLDRIDSNALNPQALANVKSTASELGKVISNLPLPFGQDAQKLRFSDLPSGLKDLMTNMIDRVGAKIGKKDADIATQNLKSFMSGADVYSQAEVQSEMSKLLRLLT